MAQGGGGGASEPHHYRLPSCEFWVELCLEQKASGLPPLALSTEEP